MKIMLVVSWEEDRLVLHKVVQGGRRTSLPPLKTIPLQRPARLDQFSSIGLENHLGSLLSESERLEGIWFLLPAHWVLRICLDQPTIKSPTLLEKHLLWEIKQRLPDGEFYYRTLIYSNPSAGAIDVLTVNSHIVQTIHKACQLSHVNLLGVATEPEPNAPYTLSSDDDFLNGLTVDSIPEFVDTSSGITLKQVAVGVGLMVGIFGLVIGLVFVSIKYFLPGKSEIPVRYHPSYFSDRTADSTGKADSLKGQLVLTDSTQMADSLVTPPAIAGLSTQPTADSSATDIAVAESIESETLIAETEPIDITTPEVEEPEPLPEVTAPPVKEKRGFIAWVTSLFSRKPTEPEPAPYVTEPIIPPEEPVAIIPYSNQSLISRLVAVLPENSKLELAVLSRADLKFELSGAVTPEQIMTALSTDPTFPAMATVANYRIGKNQGFLLRAEASDLFTDDLLQPDLTKWKGTATGLGLTIKDRTAYGTLEQTINLLDELWGDPSGVQKLFFRPDSGGWAVTVQ